MELSISGQKLIFVEAVVIAALDKQPSLDVVDCTTRLLKSLESLTFTCDVDLRQQSQEVQDILQPPVAACAPCPIEAPYPESALGGESYDSVELTKCLPDFDRLPFEFGLKHSVIRSGEQTVIMNSCHYADLLATRSCVEAARSDANFWRTSEEAEARCLSQLAQLTVSGRVELSIADDHGFRVVYYKGDAVVASVVSANFRNAISVLLKMILYSASEQQSQPASGEATCQTKPVDSDVQAVVSQDTTDETSMLF